MITPCTTRLTVPLAEGYPAYYPCAATASVQMSGRNQEAKCLLNVDKVTGRRQDDCGPAVITSLLSAAMAITRNAGYRGGVLPADQDHTDGCKGAGDKHHHQRFVIDQRFRAMTNPVGES